MIYVIIIFAHIIINLIIALLIKFGVIKVPKLFIVISFCVPIFGFISLCLIHIITVLGLNGKKASLLEVMRISMVNDNKEYEDVPAESADDSVPLEDALLIDDAATRRSIMLDVLMAENKDYADALTKARNNDDVEVVHYATTAMAELSKEYELKLQHYAQQYAENSDDAELLTEYTNYIQSYINSGLCEGHLLALQRENYQQLMKNKIAIKAEKEDYMALLSSYLDSKDFADALDVVTFLNDKYKDDDNIWILTVRYFYETKQGDKLKKLIDERDKKDTYKPKEVKRIINFWKSK